MNTNWMKASLVFACLLAPAAPGLAGLPDTINYQAKVTQADGTPLGTGPLVVKISVYDAAVEGTRVWGPQTLTGVPITDGSFNVIIGPTDDSGTSLRSAFGSGDRYLDVALGDQPPIAPRQKILSAPFAFFAGNDVPVGGIVAWIPPVPLDGLTMAAAEDLLPLGFAVCDGPRTEDDPKTSFDERKIPQLTDARFLRGGALTEVGNAGGGQPETHGHRLFPTGQSGITVPNTDDWGSGSAGPPQNETIAKRGHKHPYDGSAQAVSVIPRHCNVIFIIRVD